ncbi:serine aminopeptidase domain-containing protein [Actinopolymorpha alba]|uniref:serine aminopeptidase domain-containing protein n=1 Tax=Actinopolymorpha alba TaxID=533267 RepID=UPI000381C8EB|nr:alpha/beta hydrolase [Actinopolymorpha alba]
MNDERTRYQAVNDEVFALYVAELYAEAVTEVHEAMPELPRYRSDLAHTAACLRAASGDAQGALDELRAAFDDGGWWHPRILLDDDDLASLHGREGFAELVSLSRERADSALDETSEPVIQRPETTPRGLLVALHGAGDGADDAADQWQAAVDAGFVLMAVESSQRNTPTYRSWPDPSVAERDIAAALASLPARDRSLPLVTAGFSAGGRQALRWALVGRPGTPVGFVVVAPAMEPEHLPSDDVVAAVRRQVDGVIVAGKDDDEVGDGPMRTHQALRQAGLACRLDVVPDLGHTYPADFASRLRAILDALVPSMPQSAERVIR